MKPTVLLLAVAGCVAATPNGYYHQEYNYKTSASSYKNNELQHQTDDQGYFRKDGDLAGRVRPRIDANSEHSEYVNPNSRTGDYNTGLVGAANGDMSSYGHMRADVGSYGAHDLSSEGLARTDHIAGNRGTAYGGYTSGSYGSNSYGSSSQSYGTTSNLRSVTSRIQQELESDIQRAIQDNRAYAQSSTSFADLERELRQNVTNRLNAELANRYGQQSIREGLSYTISNGRLHSTANYDNQELQDLRRQLESTLLNQLRTQYYQTSSRYETRQSSQGHYGYSTTTVRPVYYSQYPVAYTPVVTVRPEVRPAYPANYNTRYTPISNPQSITNIASRVQNQLDTRLNQLLDDVQRRYFSSSSSYSLTNTDVVLENLRNELRNNITYLLNEDVRTNYGNQVLRDGYMYSVGSSGQTSNQYNYAVNDLENLRSQLERNLIEKLNRDFETYRSRYQQQQQQSAYSQSSHGSSNVQYTGYVTPRYDTYSTYSTPRYDIYSTPRYRTYESDVDQFSPRPSSPNIASLITSGGIKGGGISTGGISSSASSSSDRHYSLLAGSRQAGYEISGSSGSNIGQLQRQLQSDLSRQLQAAISRGQYGSYSSSGSYQPQTYEVSLQQLTDELNRNLTRQLQEYSSGGYYSSYGNLDQSQLASLRSQLQSDLQRQLQQGLQQSYHSSSSYSASSSSSSSSGNANYRPARGFDNYQSGQYRSGSGVFATNGADCVGDDPNAYSNSYRTKRSYIMYRSQPIGLRNTGQNYNSGYIPNPRPSYGTNQQVEQELGQVVDESDSTQQVQDASFEKLQQGQVDDDSDLTQQVEDSGIGRLRLGQQVDQNQQTDNSDLTQQAEDIGSGKLQLGSQGQYQVGLGQQVDDSDLTQQVEDWRSNRLRLGSQTQQQVDLGQQVDDSDLTQQVEDSRSNRLRLGSQTQQQVDDSDLTQQVEDSHSNRLRLGSQTQQQVDDSDLTQQVEDSRSNRLRLGSQTQQQVDDSDLTQQVEDSRSNRLRLGSQTQQQVDDSDLTQQVEDLHSNRLRLGSQTQQQVDDSDLTQQAEDLHSNRLRLGSQTQQQVDDSDLTQQVEDLRSNRLRLGSQTQQQVDLGQQIDDSDSTQQVEDLQSNRLRLGSQTQQQVSPGQRIDDPYSTQRLPHSGLGNLQLGSQRQHQIDLGSTQQQIQSGQYVDNSDSTQQVEDPDLTQQVENSGLGNLRLTSQNQEQTGRGLAQRQDRIQLGQQEDNSDITQQQQQQVVGSGGQWQTTYPFGGINPTYEYFGANFNQKQKEIIRQIQTDLSKQLEDAVKNYQVSYPGSTDYQSTYENILRELERNLTKQLLAASSTGGSNGYSYTFQFSSPQVVLLQKQLENKLKLKLQQEISNAASTNLNPQQTQVISNSELYPQSHRTLGSYDTQQNSNSQRVPQQTGSGSDYLIQTETTDGQLKDPTLQTGNSQISQQLGNNNGRIQLGTQESVQQPINSDQQSQQVEDINVQLPETPDDSSQSGGWPQVSSISQFRNRPTSNNLGLNIDQLSFSQKQTAYQIRNELSIQLRDAVKNYYSGSLTSQSNYEDILRELERNLTKQLQTVGPNSSGYSYTYQFSGPQLTLLKSWLEDGLNSQLQQEISNQAGINLNQQQTQVISGIGLYPPSYNSLGTHETEQNGHSQVVQQQENGFADVNPGSQQIVQQPINTDQENQQVEDVNVQLPDTQDAFSHPSRRLHPWSNLQIGNRPTYQYNLDSDLGQKQKQTVNQIKTELSKQLQDAVKNSDISSSGSVDYQSTYQDIFRELERNLTDQLHAIGSNGGSGGYSYTYVLSRPEVEALQKELERQLKLQLEQKISNTAENHQLQPGTQEDVPQSFDNDQQNQQVDDIIIQQPDVDSSQEFQPDQGLHASGNLQFANRPLSPRPQDNNFLQTEIGQQQNVNPYWDSSDSQNNLNQRPNNLPTLNQVLQQQQNPRHLPNRIEQLTPGSDANQQTQSKFIDNQEQNVDLPSQSQSTDIQNPYAQASGEIIIPTVGRPQEVANQGQFITQSQSQYGQTNQDSRSYIYQNRVPQPTQQSDSFSQTQDSFQTYLNAQQVQLAHQLENDLYNQLLNAVYEHRRTIPSTSYGTISRETYRQTKYEKLLRELPRNVANQLQLDVYSSITQEQREKLAEDLVADLTSKLQRHMRIDGVRQNSGQTALDSTVTYSSAQRPSFYGPGPGEIYSSFGTNSNHGSTTNQLSYGQQEVVPESESVAQIQPIEPVLPSVVENVESPASQNIGVKGRRIPRPTVYNPPQSSQVENVGPFASAPTRDSEVVPPQVELVTPLAPSSGTQEITAEDEAQQKLSWYKRFHNKVKQGVASLKEKIIG